MPDIISAVAAVGESYKFASSIFDDIFIRIERVRQKNLSHDNLIRAYYFEVVNNIELFSIINILYSASEGTR